MKTLKIILLLTSHTIAGIIGGLIFDKFDHEFRIRKVLNDAEEIKLERKEAEIAQEREELEIEKAKEKIRLDEKRARVEYQRQAQLIEEAELETRKKALKLAQAERESRPTLETMLKHQKVTERHRVGRICDKTKCIYQVKVIEKTYFPITNQWLVTNTSETTETETLNQTNNPPT